MDFATCEIHHLYVKLTSTPLLLKHPKPATVNYTISGVDGLLFGRRAEATPSFVHRIFGFDIPCPMNGQIFSHQNQISLIQPETQAFLGAALGGVRPVRCVTVLVLRLSAVG